MFEQCLYPKSIPPDVLDVFLSKGWFRMGQSIFTTQYVLFDGRMYPSIWLRHDLKYYSETKTILNLKKRNKHFRVELKQANITPIHEELFRHYKMGIQFNAAQSLHQLLNGYSIHDVSIYNTYEINIYDRNQLIACSYFDIGTKSAEGISAYYNPDYRSSSLGKYMIYLQIEICKKNGLDYFYPGYFVPGFPHLDYKLDIGTACLEYLDIDSMLWYPINEFNDEGIPIEYQEYFLD